MDYENVKNVLQNNLCKVVFTKKDGTERTIYGTLNKQTVDSLYEFKGKDTKENLSLMPIFDMENHAWRSFTFANLLTIDVINFIF